jgi:MFS-type transporter involved in bile tolerance (Atg22 family)
MLPASGWISRRIGRKRLLMLSILTFTCASLLCGIAISMPMLIFARVLQGIGGGGMQPLAQSILLESFPPSQHGTAMAVYGVGIVVAPVIGPTLGGWITDSYSWRWIFYINLPVGILALFMARAFIEDPPYIKKALQGSIDYLGFGLMALWLGTLQLVGRRRFRDRSDRFHRSRIHESRAHCATAHTRQPQLRRRNAHHGCLRLCPLRFHGDIAALPANSDGLFGAEQRTVSQSPRHRCHDLHDCGGGVDQAG